MKFNSGFTFSNYWDWQTDTVDLETILVHELGHAHGLGHPYQRPNSAGMTSAEIASVMNFVETTKRVPKPDDIAGIVNVYH